MSDRPTAPPEPADAEAPTQSDREPSTLGKERSPVDLPLGAELPRLLASGAVVGGRYRVEAFVATGGMGEVYRAVHLNLKRKVALKLVRGDLSGDATVQARFLREARLLSQLESPHVVKVYDFGQAEDGRLFLAMELVDGRGLDAIVREERKLAPARAIALLLQVCEGLDEAHGCGIVHRDLKPPNIMVGRRRSGAEVARILDFGIARPTDDAQASTLTAAGVSVGTPAYMSPEQVRGEKLDARSDIYSLGCVAWRLLCGRTPFTGDAVLLVARHLSEPPPAPEAVAAELSGWPTLCEVLAKSLRKNPAERYQTARELSAALKAALAAQPTEPQTAFPDWPPPDAAPPAAELPEWPPPEPVPSPQPQTPADEFFQLQVSSELLPAKDEEE